MITNNLIISMSLALAIAESAPFCKLGVPPKAKIILTLSASLSSTALIRAFPLSLLISAPNSLTYPCKSAAVIVLSLPVSGSGIVFLMINLSASLALFLLSISS